MIEISVKESGLNVGDVEVGSTDLGMNTRSPGMFRSSGRITGKPEITERKGTRIFTRHKRVTQD